MTTPAFSTAHGQKSIQRVLVLLADKPMTTEQLGVALCKSRTAANKYLAVLRAEKKVRIVGWGAVVNGGGKPPIFGLGSGPDKVQPVQRVRPKPRRKAERVKPVTLADKALAYLALYPDSRTPAIAAAMGSTPAVATTILQRLRRDGKVQAASKCDGRPLWWSLARTKRLKDEPVQTVKRQWAPLPVKPQSWAAALGL